MNETRSVFIVVITGLILITPVTLHTAEFEPDVIVSNPFDSIEFGRNTQGAMAVDSTGTVHLVYTVTDDSSGVPRLQVWWQSVENGIPGTPERMDRGGVEAIHPAIAIDSSDTIHAVWQDARHSTALGHWIDNIEIYTNRKPPGEGFLADDVRLTQTQAGHGGDNGFVPQITIDPKGRLHVTWYDFHLTGERADIYFISSQPDGELDTVRDIEPHRIASDEVGGGSYWAPVPAYSGNDTLTILWGYQEDYSGLYTLLSRTMSGSGEWSGIETVAESGGRFFDPPRLFPDRMGNLGLVYPNLAEDRFGLFFQYRPVGGVWSEAVRIDSGNASATQPSIVFDTQGKAHVVWQEGDAWFSDIFYTTIDPQTMTVSSGKRLNSGEFSARQPVIALDSMTNRLSVAWIETGEDGGKSIHLRNEITTPVRNWSLF